MNGIPILYLQNTPYDKLSYSCKRGKICGIIFVDSTKCSFSQENVCGPLCLKLK